MTLDYTTWDRTQSCEGKIKYSTRKAAKKRCKFLARMLRRKGLEPYLCRHCHWFHVGHGKQEWTGLENSFREV